MVLSRAARSSPVVGLHLSRFFVSCKVGEYVVTWSMVLLDECQGESSRTMDSHCVMGGDIAN